MKKRLFWTVIWLMGFLLFSGCTQESLPSVVERQTRTENMTMREYEFPNCESEEVLKNEQTVKMSFIRDATVVVSPGLDMDVLPLKLLIAEHYWVDSPVSEAESNILVNVPAGYIYTYVVAWDRVVRIGEIVQDGAAIANYEFVEDLIGNSDLANMAICTE